LNKRVLYILIVVLVLVVGGFLIIPKLVGGGGKKPTTSARARRTSESDTTKSAPAKGKRARGRAAKEAEAKPEAKPVEKVETPVIVRDTTPVQWVEDPFVRDWLMAGELRDMKLRAVTIGEKSLALINDRIVAKGDTINGKRVAEITRDSVVFEFGGQRRGLKIGE
jgi:hypothetical protein